MDTVVTQFEAQVGRTPSNIAVTMADQAVSYADLNQQANRVAHGLLQRGIKPGEFVGICMDRSVDMVAAIFGILKAGAVYVPLDPEYPAERLAYMLADASVACLLSSSSLRNQLQQLELATEVMDVASDFSSFDSSNPNIAVAPDQLIYMIYTSGSTGQPKGSLVKHVGFSNLVNWYVDEFDMDDTTRILHITSPAFDLTQKNVFAPLICGGCLCLLDQRIYDTSIIIDHIEHHAATLVNCTPSAFSRLLNYANDSLYKRLASLKHVVLGGEPIVMSRLIDWLSSEFCNAQIINSYGPTECTDVVCFYQVAEPKLFVDKNVPIGTALPGFELRIVDENNQRVTQGQVGQLAIAGIGVGAGYHKQPEMTDRSFVPDTEAPDEKIYLTGDNAKIDSDGNIDFLGRIDNQVKIRGFRIELSEIERTLESHPGIHEAACSTYKDASGDNKLAAYLVYSDAAQSPANNEVRAYLQKTLPDFMLPTAWIALEKLPLTPNGKLDRKQLPAPLAKRPSLNVQYAAPSSELQQYLGKLWLELLAIDKVGIDDRFFELGGSSLNAVDFITRLSSELGVVIPITAFFDKPSIRGFENVLWQSYAEALTQKFSGIEAPASLAKQDLAKLAKRRGAANTANTDIAIIGMSGRYPGADNTDELWANLLDGVEAVSFASDEELRELGVSEDDIADEDYVHAYFSMDDVDYFDADFFGYQPREIETMDPQHRLFLELAWTCLDNAGYGKLQDDQRNIGVFGGIARDAYLVNYVAKDPTLQNRLEDFAINMGNDKNFPSSRVAYKFDLTGPAVNVQTACSTSGTALHMACQSLRNNDCDAALVGGCRVLVPTKLGYRYVEGSALSRDGHIYAFDARGTGMVRGSGGSFVLIKQLDKALADGDCIRAVIKSTAINNDGSNKIGFTAPSVDGQSEVVADAILQSGVDAESISYVETHGTATALGDPIELRALDRAYKHFTQQTGFCRIGSLKTNIGHLDAGAAVSGLVKTAMAMEQRQLPASLNFDSANKEIDFEQTPFMVNASSSAWLDDGNLPLRAGISSFGLGGTNFHAILEACAQNNELTASNDTGGQHTLIALSAKSKLALERSINAVIEYCEAPANQKTHPANLAYSINCFRQELERRAVLLLPTGSPITQAIKKAVLLNPGEQPKLLCGYKSTATELIDTELMGVATQWLASESVDWHNYYQEAQHNIHFPYRKVALPTYQYDRRRHWIDLPKKGCSLFLLANSSEQFHGATEKWATYANQCELAKLTGIAKPLVDTAAVDAEARLSCLASTSGQIAQQLANVAAPTQSKSCVFMFPGGGSQYVNMGKGLYDRISLVRNILDEGFLKYRRLTGINLKKLWFPTYARQADASAEMLRPSIQLPAIFLIEYALAKLWMSWGVSPSALVGHSVGENTAACVAGVFSFDDCLALVTLRGQLFEKVAGGGMLSVALSADAAAAYLGDNLDIATVNGPDQCTISGEKTRLEQLKQEFETDDIDAQIVPINIAAHSRSLEPILEEFGSFLGGLKLNTPSIQFASNLTGDWISAKQATDPNYWVQHLRNTVQFANNIAMLSKLEQPAFLECGPGRILSSLVATQVDSSIPIISSTRHASEKMLDFDFSLQAAGKLWAAGFPVELSKLNEIAPASVLLLPAEPPSQSAEAQVEAAVEVVAAKSYASRYEYLLDTIKSILFDLSGIPVQSLSETNTFLELGFDSLFLTQANLKFKKAFVVKLTLRQLLREAPTIAQLAAYIDDKLDPGALQDEVAGQGGNATESNTSPALLTKVASNSSSTSAAEAPDSGESVVAGPFRQIEKSASSSLTAKQTAYLDKFKQAYITKTAKSQAFNEAHRDHYADPRTVMGFKQDWKDLTYTIVAERSKGSQVIDIDGNEYVDCMSGFGAIFFGHNPDFVKEAITRQIEDTLDYGPQSKLAGPTAQMICEMTGMDRASFCNTGSEAVLAAIRVSRTVTGNDLIVTFNGDYHGIFDEMLVKSQTVGQKKRNVPMAPGIPQSSNQHVLVLEYGDPQAIEVIRQRADEIAAVVIEPIQSRRPELQPKEFLTSLREVTRDADIPMVFDEIITGFRLHPKGAQAWFDVEVDIACYGKVIGGGIPVGVIAGKRKYMDALDGGAWHFGDDSFPEVGVTYFAGTFIRHPIAIAAVHAVMQKLKAEGPGLQLGTNLKAALFSEELNQWYRANDIPIVINYFGSVYFPRFLGNSDYESLFAHHLRFYGAHHIWGGRPGFLTTAHSEADIAILVEAFKKAATTMREGGFLPEQRTVLESFEWTPQQRELWLACKFNADAGPAYNEQIIFNIPGQLDRRCLELAIDKTVNRHQSLRAIVRADETGLDIVAYAKPEFKYLSSADLNATSSTVDAELQDSIDQTFDYFTGPMVRFSLLEVSKNETIFAFCASHLVIDGWSLEKITEEICGNYTAIRNGRYFQPRKENLLQDYIATLSEIEKSHEMHEAKAYWQSAFATLPPHLELPTATQRPAHKSFNGLRFVREVRGQHVPRLHQLAQQSNSTLFTVLLSAYYVLLNRLSGNEDIVVGIPAAGQPHIGMTNLVAHTVSFLPMRLSIDRALPYTDFLEHVHNNFFEAKEHQDYSYGQLVQDINPSRDPSRLPLLSTCFNMDMPFNEIVFDGLKANFVTTPRGYVKYDLYFNVTDMGDYLALEVDYNTDLYSRALVDRWLDLYENILVAISSDKDADIASFSEAVPDEQKNIINSWNNTDRDYGLASKTLHGLIDNAVEQYRDNVAIIDEDTSLTYAELGRRTNQLANYLLDADLSIEDKVAILMDRSVDMVVAINGVLKAGGAYIPLDPEHPPERIAAIIEQASCAAIITQASLRDLLTPIADKALILNITDSAIYQSSEAPLPGIASANSLAYVIYTSGSTGKPKGVMIEHQSICNHTLWMAEQYRLTEQDVVLQKTPYTFDVSLWELFLPLISGARLIMARPGGHRETSYLIETIEKHQVTHIHFVASMLGLFLQSNQLDRCSSIQCVFTSGEAVTKTLENEYLAKFPNTPLWNLYGPTEAAVHTTYWQCGQREGESVPIGRPIANTRCYIVNEQMNLQPIGSVGELLLGGVQVARGYLNQPTLTAKKFIPDPFSAIENSRLYKTGDLARYAEDGTIEYVGRNDFQVKLRGLRIELGEIEARLVAISAIRQAVVLVKNHDSLVAYIVADPSVLDKQDITSALSNWLPVYMVPGQYVYLDEMPLTPSGKMDRKALAALTPEPARKEREQEKLIFTAEQKYLAEVWAALLEDEEICLDDNFFDIGGHSLLAAKVSMQVQNEKNIEIPLRDFITMTLAQLAEVHLTSTRPDAVNTGTGAQIVSGEAAIHQSPIKKSLFNKIFKR